ncbi:unnamed protein product [Toxocara canis]|uniref:Transmembrane protein 39A n=1 Tax=Toxocara canis TaxID=6265 RepID=A0A183ULP9_TOXCA|nr:unnamed protein product [Toxocara canis]
MVGRSAARNRHHGNRAMAQTSSAAAALSSRIDERRRSEDCAGLTVQMHPVWPEMPQGQGELFFECTLFLYSVLALFLQYLNLYKTLWWLPKSYWHYSMKFHLINPYLLSCVGLLLGLRVTKCFWNTISELASSASQGASGTQLLIWRIVEWAFVKTPMFTMVATSFMFSFSRVYADFPFKSLLYFGHPLIFFIFLYYCELLHKLHRLISAVHFVAKGGDLGDVANAPLLFPSLPVPQTLVDVDSVVHMCSSDPAQIREEVAVLTRDFNLRMKHCLFSGLSTAYLSIFVPCVFTPQRSPSGMPQQMHVDIAWVIELFLVVFLTSFALYITYLLPIQYCDLLHRSATHLGRWEKVDLRIAPPPSNLPLSATTTTHTVYQLWEPDSLYAEGTVVRHEGQTYRAHASTGALGVAAEPGDPEHLRFYRVGAEPVTLINAMCLFEVALIAAQFWMLVLTTDWQHIVTLVLLMFANYLLLAKVFKDRVVIGRIYNPSPEDLQLIKQMQQGVRKTMLCKEVSSMNARDVFKLTGKPIVLQLLNGKMLSGNVYTLDPATRSLIIFQFHQQESIRMCLIPGDAFGCLEVVESGERLPDGCTECTSQLVDWLRSLMGIVRPATQLNSHFQERKKALVNWLRANGAYDAKEDDEHTIHVFDDVLIRPPYTPDDCFCDNSRALLSIQSSIRRFDAQHSQKFT